MTITTDFHSHILPCADHGSDSVETSRAQLDIIGASGIKRVVATPHFYPSRDNVRFFLERRLECAKNLSEVMREDDVPVMLGAEVLICEGIEKMEGLDRLTVLGTNCILLEMPMTKWSTRLFETVEAIRDMNLVPVMAHVDRYVPKDVDVLLSLGVRAQLNPNAFSNRKQRKNAERWLADGKIVAVGSDFHMADARSYKNFVEFTNMLGGYGQHIEQNMLELLSGAKVVRGK